MKKNPHLYETNAFFFLSRMIEKYGRRLTLLTIPNDEWKSIAKLGFDYIWLMGVWTRSPESADHAIKEPSLRHSYDMVLPKWTEDDVKGSPYAIYDYVLDPFLGRPEDLLQLKLKLNGMGLHLILDFVPNHLAVDHVWTETRSEIFVSATAERAKENADWFFTTAAGKKIAHGRDPYFAPWIDTAQINFWSKAAREAALKTLLNIARVSDGVRCDMAMLALNEIFEKVWGSCVKESRPKMEFWTEIISLVKKIAPNFIFIGEVYWDMDWKLQRLGFDYTYDKKFYDRLFYDSPIQIREHLKADSSYADKCLRFVENHDEERSAVIFGKQKAIAAGIITSTIPGLRFFYDGQMEGRRIRTPIHLCREPKEPVDKETSQIYKHLLQFIKNSVTHEGEWTLLETSQAWDKNETYPAILSWLWGQGEDWKLVVVNYSLIRAQAYIHLPDFLNRKCFIQFKDVLTDKLYDRTGEELFRKGLYTDLQPWQAHLFDFKA